MTISTTTARIAYAGNGVTDTFPTTFPFFDASEIVVTERVVATGAETPRLLTTDYTVGGGGGSTGAVVAVVPPPSTVQWILSRATARTQETDYTANDPFPAETHERALDRLTLIAQEIEDALGRTLKFPGTDPVSLGAVLPSSVARADALLAFDADGAPKVLAQSALTASILPTPFAAGLLGDADAAAALATLGIATADQATKGVVELAAAAEVAAGTDTERAVTPAGLAAGYLGQGVHTIYVPAAAMLPTVSNGCASLAKVETTAGRPDLRVLDFDGSADEHAQFEVAFPASWDAGTLGFRVFWTTAATDADGVAWSLQAVARGDGDPADAAYGTAVVVTDAAQSAAADVLVTPVSAALTVGGTPAAGALTIFRLFRDVSNAADTMAEDARLLGVQLFYTVNARTDA